jgi:hypothetical protein
LPVPGWPYFHIGEPLAGRVIVGLFVGLLVPALIFMGTYSGSILLGLAFTVHSATVLGLLFRYGGEALGRVQVGVLVLAGLGFGVYLPAGWAVTQIARPLTVRAAGEPLAEGDVLLLNRVAYRFSDPRPGDVVLYHAEEFRIPARVAGPFPVVIAGRERIDRILAGPGARVRWAEGRLSVDGAESPLRPLNPAAAPRRFEAEVPAGHYLIFATTLPRADIGLPDDYWGRTSLVPARQIEGRVSLRTQPFSRFGRIR